MTFLITYIVPFLKQYWKIIAIVLIFLATFFGGFFYSKSHWQAPLLKEIATYKIEQEKFSKKLKDITEQSITDAQKMKTDLAEKDKKIDDITKLYNIEKNKKHIVYVKVKDSSGQENNIELMFEGDNLVCNRFPSEFTTTYNKMIEEANK